MTIRSSQIVRDEVTAPTMLYPIQYARGFAAMAVFYYHISTTIKSTYNDANLTIDAVGAAGVDLFFVISGFIICLVVSKKQELKIFQFLSARLLRIAPLYWIFTGFVFLIALIKPSLLGSTTADLSNLIHSIAFVHNGGSEQGQPILFVGWTLNYEFFFYFIAALSASLLRDRGLKMASVIIIFIVVLGQISRPTNGYAQFYTDPILLEFVYGIACFHIYQATQSMKDSKLWHVLFVVGLGMLILQFELNLEASRALVWGVPCFLILLGGVHAVRYHSPLLKSLGDWSYTIYLVHLFVVIGYIRILLPKIGWMHLPWWTHYITMTFILLAVSWGVYTFVEKPLMRFSKYFK